MVDLRVLLERAVHIKNTYATPYDFEVLEAVERAIAAEAALKSISECHPSTDESATLVSMAREALSKLQTIGVKFR